MGNQKHLSFTRLLPPPCRGKSPNRLKSNLFIRMLYPRMVQLTAPVIRHMSFNHCKLIQSLLVSSTLTCPLHLLPLSTLPPRRMGRFRTAPVITKHFGLYLNSPSRLRTHPILLVVRPTHSPHLHESPVISQRPFQPYQAKAVDLPQNIGPNTLAYPCIDFIYKYPNFLPAH